MSPESSALISRGEKARIEAGCLREVAERIATEVTRRRTGLVKNLREILRSDGQRAESEQTSVTRAP
jgi:uncharacterized tellurite resistance protein B-like protein